MVETIERLLVGFLDHRAMLAVRLDQLGETEARRAAEHDQIDQRIAGAQLRQAQFRSLALQRAAEHRTIKMHHARHVRRAQYDMVKAEDAEHDSASQRKPPQQQLRRRRRGSQYRLAKYSECI